VRQLLNCKPLHSLYGHDLTIKSQYRLHVWGVWQYPSGSALCSTLSEKVKFISNSFRKDRVTNTTTSKKIQLYCWRHWLCRTNATCLRGRCKHYFCGLHFVRFRYVQLGSHKIYVSESLADMQLRALWISWQLFTAFLYKFINNFTIFDKRTFLKMIIFFFLKSFLKDGFIEKKILTNKFTSRSTSWYTTFSAKCLRKFHDCRLWGFLENAFKYKNTYPV